MVNRLVDIASGRLTGADASPPPAAVFCPRPSSQSKIGQAATAPTLEAPVNLRTSPDDYFRAALVTVSRLDPWLLQALDCQSEAALGGQRPSSFLPDQDAVRDFLVDLRIDAWVAWPPPTDAVPDPLPIAVSATPEKILTVIRHAIDRGRFTGITVCSFETNVTVGIQKAREWFLRRRSASGNA